MRRRYCEGVEQRYQIKTARLTGCKNFVGKRKKFIFNAFVELCPKKSSTGSLVYYFFATQCIMPNKT